MLVVISGSRTGVAPDREMTPSATLMRARVKVGSPLAAGPARSDTQ